MLEPSERGRLGMNVRFASPTELLFGLAAVCLFPACSSPVVLPQAVGDCMGTADASCASPTYGSTTAILPSEGGTSSADDTGSAIADTGTCGTSVLLITPANPLCLPCISTAAPAGCCQAAAACAADATCPIRVQCGSLGTLATCPVTQDLIAAQLVTCLEANCSPQCSDIVLQLSGDQ
jgi:hypothetical protein